MEGIGAEVSHKIRSAIKAKFKEIGLHVDEELPDYVMVMVANKRSKEQMDEDLQLFLGRHTSLFTTWLHQVLQKLEEVTVANLDLQKQANATMNTSMHVEGLIGLELYENRQSIGGVKRKSSDEPPKKKKKSKQDVERKEIKKKIKEEPEDKSKDGSVKDKGSRRESINQTESDKDKDIQNQEEKPNKKQKSGGSSKPSLDQNKESVCDPKTKKQREDLCDSSHEELSKKAEDLSDGRKKSLSISSQVEDLDDEDCINIRTDGELLDTAEDINVEEPIKKTKEKEKKDSNSKSKVVKRTEKQTNRHSPPRSKDKSKPSDHNGLDRGSGKEKPFPSTKWSPSPPKTPPKTDDKVVDARELLNRKKAAKQSESKARSRSRSRDRNDSLSPVRKRREDERETRNYREERGAHRRVREEERESNRKHSREEERDRRAPRDRDAPTVKRKDDWSRKLESDKINQRGKERRRDLSMEPPPKRVMLDRTFKTRNDDWGPNRGAKISEERKDGRESPKRKDTEEESRRPGLVSRVVARVPEPEEEMEAPGGVPSVVKVTPRPRRPPSQQPSTSLIMRAISEANKSLANVPPRPDSTQRGRKEPVFSRTLRQLRRIPPEKIAVEIRNPLALQTVERSEEKDDDARSVSPIPKDKSGRNMSPPSDHFNREVTPSEPDLNIRNTTKTQEVEEQNEAKPEGSVQEGEPEDEIELEPSQDLEAFDEPMDEASEPQFVVTLNGYDPDGIFSQSELEDEEEPLLTSTPEEVESPRSKSGGINSSPNVIMGAPAVNHNNLIEVEIMRAKSERCKYWPACRLADKCTYYHPSKPCKVFPNCKFGDSCLYIHPQCKYNALCTRKDCVFAHTAAHTPAQPTVIAPKAKALYAASAPLCKFFPNCTNSHCQFTHPPRACRFGLYCTKKDCCFDHGQVAPIDKLKWTRVSSS